MYYGIYDFKWQIDQGFSLWLFEGVSRFRFLQVDIA